MLPSQSDAQLVNQALADHGEAFGALVFRYQKKAFAVARALGVSSPQVDDVVQDAFLKAFENLPRLRSPERFGLWFLNIVRNGARKSFRMRRTGRELSATDLDGQPDTLSPEHKELDEEVSKSVSELPETLRETISLYYYEGESVREVARALQVSEDAVLKRLERGRGLLQRQTLAVHGRGDP